MFLIDTHCHIQNLDYIKLHTNIDSVLHNAYLKNIKMFLAVSTSIPDFKNLIQFTKNKKNIFLSCGLHPTEKHEKLDIIKVKKYAKNNSVIAIGETGLDFYRSKKKKNQQIDLFKQHIYISQKINKPIIIHSRHAKNETINTLYAASTENKKISGILHSFNEDIDMARKVLDLGLYISMSGIITFKTANYLRKILNFIPIDRLLIETDSPYLSPEPMRKIENQPSFLYYIAKYIAGYIKIDFFKFVSLLQKNFFKLFNISHHVNLEILNKT